MKISLIIPVYNKELFLKRCLDSVAEQYEKPFQVILVDDGSTDSSKDICDEYAKKYTWEVYHQSNRGVSVARNLGITKANGDYITFLDADDLLMPDAIAVMKNIAYLGHNIVQFRQYRCWSMDSLNMMPYGASSGYYDFAFIPQYWVIVWNKIYKKSFLDKNNLRFREGMQFGEDAVFNAECILANGGLYHASQATVIHCLDDKKSLCRGTSLNLDRIRLLDSELCGLAGAQTDICKKKWLERAIDEHRNTKLYKRLGFSTGTKGPYDIVYFVKDWPVNYELKYSLRSVEENWPCNNVWFCGGCPDDLTPDKYFRAMQSGPDKWSKVRSMIRQVCANKEITDNFWLFNDDFFILKSFVNQTVTPTYNGELESYVDRVERRIGGPDDFTERLRVAALTLKQNGRTTFNYEVHKPMLINKQKALEVLDEFPGTPAFRSLYGNYWKIGGVNKHDMKVKVMKYSKMDAVANDWEYLSTDDESFAHGEVGEFIRARFTRPSRFEK